MNSMGLFKSIKRIYNRTDDAPTDELIMPVDRKGALAERVLYCVIDATSEILSEDNNAIIRADKYRSNGVWNGYLEELIQGESPVFYIDTSGIIRMQYYSGELCIIHSGDMPSKISGKTVQDVWGEVKDKYNPKISSLMSDLQVE